MSVIVRRISVKEQRVVFITNPPLLSFISSITEDWLNAEIKEELLEEKKELVLDQEIEQDVPEIQEELKDFLDFSDEGGERMNLAEVYKVSSSLIYFPTPFLPFFCRFFPPFII